MMSFIYSGPVTPCENDHTHANYLQQELLKLCDIMTVYPDKILSYLNFNKAFSGAESITLYNLFF